MNEHSSLQCHIQIPFDFEVHFTRDLFSEKNVLFREILLKDQDPRVRKVMVIIDEQLIAANSKLLHDIIKYFSLCGPAIQLVGGPLLMVGTEQVKNDNEHLIKIYSQFEQYKLCRHSYVCVMGGGALLDVVGFAVATAHRGLRLIRIPTTTLSQADGGVGVKNGINAFGKKNYIGTFAPPFAVINDFSMLRTLPRDLKRSGYIEAVKVALIRDASFFDFIESNRVQLRDFEETALENVIYRCASLHLNHIATSGDPFELGSARPLDFGHWSAHKLEQLSDFKISHGKAVVIGIALDVVYSKLSGFLDSKSIERILNLLRDLDFSIFHAELLRTNSDGELLILEGLEEFREHLGGKLTITLLKGIGKGFEVNEMDRDKIVAAIHELKLCSSGGRGSVRASE